MNEKGQNWFQMNWGPPMCQVGLLNKCFDGIAVSV